MNDPYKVKILKEMIKEDDGYGARLHHHKIGNVLTIDVEAMKVLIKHYGGNIDD